MISTVPVLPLETFRELIGYNPWWFWGMADQSEALRPGAQSGLQGCPGVVREFAWQDRDYAGRDDIRKAIARAERRIEEQLKFYPGPVYVEETVEWPRLSDQRFLRSGPYGSDGRWLSVRLSTGWIRSIGVEARTLVSSSTSVNYVDEDNDGYAETATIGPITTSAVSDVKEVAVYFTTTDRFGVDNSVSERWRIAPLNITISGGQLTIRGPAWIFVRPARLTGINVQNIDPNASPSPFASSVDIYRRYTDGSSTDVNSSQGVIIWETRPCHGWWCVCSSCTTDPFSGSPDDPAATARAVARVGIRDSKGGFVTPAESMFNSVDGIWSASSWDVCEQPDRVTVRYLAGYPIDSDGQMSVGFRELVAIMAAAELGRSVSGCAESNRLLFYWQQDLSKTGREDDLYATSADILDNPFGTRRGHVYVWHQIQHLARGTGIRA